MIRRTLLLLLLLCTNAVFAGRQPAETAAALVEEMFVDVAGGKKIASELRRRAAAGEFDKLTGTALAEAMTAAMHAVELDKHNNVRFNAASAAEPYLTPAQALQQLKENRQRGPRRPGPAELANAKRNNFGVKRVEVLPGNIGYLRLDQFAPLELVRETLSAAMQILGNTDAVIVDLRENSGGSGDTVGYLSSYFLPADDRVLMIRHSRELGAMESKVVETPTRRFENVPLFVLTSDRTFSAGEAFAFGLQGYGRATVIGETTSGGGRPNAFMPLGGGLQLSVSIASSVHPKSGKGWQGTGVVPEIATKEEEALDAALNAARTKIAGDVKLAPHIEALLAALNGPAAEFEPFAQKQYAKSLLEQRSVAERATFIERIQNDFGKVYLLKPVEITPTKTVIEISGAKGITGELAVEHEAAPPHPFKTVTIRRRG
ncbi:MAG TPA: S41 family peptidase [Thermoanaerobaculia bacterium]|jgi:hypothetical protein